MNEFELIAHYFQQQPALLPPGHPESLLPAWMNPLQSDSLLLGIGDDCALLDALQPGEVLAVSADMLVAGRHFFDGTPAESLGHKALAVNLSDLAAMGARPLGFTLALALPEVNEVWLSDFSRGLLRLASRAACPLIGGDTTRGPLNIAITVMGAVPAARALRRDGARPGDEIWVSGPLGAASLAVAQREAGSMAEPEAAARLDWPMPRLSVGLALRELATAAMDISDGLAGDLGHLLVASGRRGGESLAAQLNLARLPVASVLRGHAQDQVLHHALHGGDDYELLFTASPASRASIETRIPDAHRIGQIVPGQGILLVDEAGCSRPASVHGHDHFA
ncbi:MAG: thiamine-phosphate kinase [Lautropia sp.]|nr:thiamine-phosphate kinase [Lautropia sp.]